jgi:hypothetical protein
MAAPEAGRTGPNDNVLAAMLATVPEFRTVT